MKSKYMIKASGITVAILMMVAVNAQAKDTYPDPLDLPSAKVVKPSVVVATPATVPAKSVFLALKDVPAKPAEIVVAKPVTPVALPVVVIAAKVVNPSASSSSNVSLYRQLDELRSQNAILTESLKNAELKNNLNKVGNTQTMVPSLSAGGPAGMPNNFSGTSTTMASAQAQTASVQMVSGSGSKLIAVLSLPDGGHVTVRVGSNIAGLGVVKSISRNEVVVANKKDTITLSFADSSSVLGGTR